MMVIQEERTHKIFRLANKLLSKQSISIPLIMHMNSKPFYFMEIFYDYLQPASRQKIMPRSIK